jgi:hypothetical protein
MGFRKVIGRGSMTAMPASRHLSLEPFRGGVTHRRITRKHLRDYVLKKHGNVFERCGRPGRKSAIRAVISSRKLIFRGAL